MNARNEQISAAEEEVPIYSEQAESCAAEAQEEENQARALTDQIFSNGKYAQRDEMDGQIDPAWRDAIIGLAKDWAKGPCPAMPNAPDASAVAHTKHRKLATMVGPGQLMLTHMNYYYMEPCNDTGCHVETRKVSEVRDVPQDA